jgi:hypothetical protein
LGSIKELPISPTTTNKIEVADEKKTENDNVRKKNSKDKKNIIHGYHNIFCDGITEFRMINAFN